MWLAFIATLSIIESKEISFPVFVNTALRIFCFWSNFWFLSQSLWRMGYNLYFYFYISKLDSIYILKALSIIKSMTSETRCLNLNPYISYLTLRKGVNISVPQFPHLWNSDNNYTYYVWVLWGLDIEYLDQLLVCKCYNRNYY